MYWITTFRIDCGLKTSKQLAITASRNFYHLNGLFWGLVMTYEPCSLATSFPYKTIVFRPKNEDEVWQARQHMTCVHVDMSAHCVRERDILAGHCDILTGHYPMSDDYFWTWSMIDDS